MAADDFFANFGSDSDDDDDDDKATQPEIVVDTTFQPCIRNPKWFQSCEVKDNLDLIKTNADLAYAQRNYSKAKEFAFEAMRVLSEFKGTKKQYYKEFYDMVARASAHLGEDENMWKYAQLRTEFDNASDRSGTLYLANLQLSRKDFPAARQSIIRCLEFHHTSGAVWSMLAEAYRGLGEPLWTTAALCYGCSWSKLACETSFNFVKEKNEKITERITAALIESLNMGDVNFTSDMGIVLPVNQDNLSLKKSFLAVVAMLPSTPKFAGPDGLSKFETKAFIQTPVLPTRDSFIPDAPCSDKGAR